LFQQKQNVSHAYTRSERRIVKKISGARTGYWLILQNKLFLLKILKQEV
jgi:hypothetical protein